MNSNQKGGIGVELPNTHLIFLISTALFILSMILDTLVFKFSWFFINLFLPVIRISLFIVTIAVSIFLIRKSHSFLFGSKQSSTLITSGLFSHVRHPLYFGILLIYPAFIFLTMSIISIIPWIIIIFLVNKMANYEEKDLERIFGEKYLEYKKKVPKLFPRLIT
ncbi:MAG: methyltransferase family protein [Promethearchaeota archaeon]